MGDPYQPAQNWSKGKICRLRVQTMVKPVTGFSAKVYFRHMDAAKEKRHIAKGLLMFAPTDQEIREDNTRIVVIR